MKKKLVNNEKAEAVAEEVARFVAEEANTPYMLLAGGFEFVAAEARALGDDDASTVDDLFYEVCKAKGWVH